MMIAISLNASVGEQETSIPEPPRIADPVEIVGAKPDGVDPVGPGPARPPDTRPRPEPSDDAARFAEPRRRRLGPPRAVLGVMTGLHGIGLPAIGAGLGGRLGVRWGPLRAALTGTHWIRRKRSVIDDVAASYQLGTGGLELCGVLALGRTPAQFELLACAEAEAGVLRAWGREASPSRTLRHRWLGLGGGLGAVWVPRSWIAVGLRIDLVVPLIGREFVIGNVSAGAIGPVDARGSLVFELRLPRIIGAG
jgi:hypothetical protein